MLILVHDCRKPLAVFDMLFDWQFDRLAKKWKGSPLPGHHLRVFFASSSKQFQGSWRTQLLCERRSIFATKVRWISSRLASQITVLLLILHVSRSERIIVNVWTFLSAFLPFCRLRKVFHCEMIQWFFQLDGDSRLLPALFRYLSSLDQDEQSLLFF